MGILGRSDDCFWRWGLAMDTKARKDGRLCMLDDGIVGGGCQGLRYLEWMEKGIMD